MAYNMTWTSTANNVFDLFSSVNSVSDGLFGMLLVSLVFLVLLASLNQYASNVRFIATSFVTTVIAALLWFGGLVAWYVATIPLVLLVASIMMDFFGR